MQCDILLFPIISSLIGNRQERDLRASFAMKVCGPTMFPIQNPVKTTAAVSCFFVKPAMLEETTVKLMLKPRFWL